MTITSVQISRWVGSGVDRSVSVDGMASTGGIGAGTGAGGVTDTGEMAGDTGCVSGGDGRGSPPRDGTGHWDVGSGVGGWDTIRGLNRTCFFGEGEGWVLDWERVSA